MGLTRKLMSMSTLGAVDFRSDKERIASYTKATKKQAQAQTKMMKRAQRADELAEAKRKIAAAKAFRAEQKNKQ